MKHAPLTPSPSPPLPLKGRERCSSPLEGRERCSSPLKGRERCSSPFKGEAGRGMGNVFHTKQSGFTLVEMAIVLVIIALLMGGVMKGQSLLGQAKVRNLISDLEGISSAVAAYQDRYRKTPGDDDQAAVRWSGAISGNGNGIVEGCYNAATTCAGGVTTNGNTSESAHFWNHLRAADFTAGQSGSGVLALPKNAVGGYLGVQTGAAVGLEMLVVCSANLTGRLAGAVDTQLDDGQPDTGRVRATQIPAQNSLPATTAPATSTRYVDDDTT
ncbi:MAG: type II secretion system protein, partial [Rhodocyclaceae bacterium]|nr:type II secretion system protein [Rhodocyclaceae bacterium]